MTVETQDTNGQPVTQSGPYAGNGVTVTFDFDFPVDRAGAVRVLVADATGFETVLEPSTDYTVDLGGPAGGSITLTSAALAPAGSKLIIQYNGDFNQSAAISNQGNLNLSVLEGALDKTTMHLRQLKNEVDRAVRISAFADANALEQLQSNIGVAANIADEIVTAAANIGAIIAAPSEAAAAAASAAAAAASETAAANSATAAAASETAAANSATAAANSTTAAAASETAAANSATLAEAWAQNPEDVAVVPGKFSARHWAAKAEATASIPDFATQAQAEAGINNNTIMTPLRTAQAIAALPSIKKWVHFQGVSPVAIRGSYGITSVTHSGTGLYTVSFTTPMPSTNYCVVGSAERAQYAGVADFSVYYGNVTTSYVAVCTGNGAGTRENCNSVFVAIIY